MYVTNLVCVPSRHLEIVAIKGCRQGGPWRSLEVLEPIFETQESEA